MIDQATIDRIHETARIEEVVSDYVTLRRRGTNYVGLCPFHDEKTPSFMVSPSKGICKCFGCSKGGNPVNFLMEVEQISYVEALRILAKKYHIEIQERELSPEQAQQQNDRESMLIINEFAASYFAKQLQTDEGKAIGLSYFVERGFHESTIEKFQLGFNPEKRDAFTHEALTKGYKEEYLVKTGLTIVGENYRTDRFRGRVMFPIHGISGRVLGFGGRILKTDAKAAKYLNSPESEVYHKSKVLYGIFHAKKEIVKQDLCYLVEGYTDVLSFHQSGIENVVASSGTALTPDQIRLISRFTQNITVIYDGDKAGINASIRGIDLILEQNINVKVVLLPDGEDPDSFAKSMNASALMQYIKENQTDFIHFKTKLLLAETQGDPVKKARLIGDIVRTISIIPDGIIRSVYIKECGSLLDVREEVLYSELNKMIRKKRDDQQYRTEREEPETMQQPSDEPAQHQTIFSVQPAHLEETELMKFLLRYGEKSMTLTSADEKGKPVEFVIGVGDFITGSIDEDNLQLETPVYHQMLDMYKENASTPGFVPEKFFIAHPDALIAHTAIDLTTEKHTLSRIFEKAGKVDPVTERLNDLVPRVVYEFKSKIVQALLNKANDDLKANISDSELTMKTLEQIKNLNEVRKRLGHILGERTIVGRG
jgi:DNA primase